ncbi:hypothetical protein BLNAU_24976 [Blattamonas nauphoetae]|uniref:Uncharacterized protein n=1 Tax=Blattamonas nauphoetae TaxID=2049346 RepID=A0ABQ9WKW5_9EUKA|nr:hypothetical protein BLNAU_24976 [Blattamonas nauphoetae]
MLQFAFVSLLFLLSTEISTDLQTLFEHIPNEIRLPKADFNCEAYLFESTNISILGENGTVIKLLSQKLTQHAPNLPTNQEAKHPPFIFRIVNSTASFGSLKLSLESQNAQFDKNMIKDQTTGTRAADFPRCAIVESSTLLLTQIEFQLETIISPLLITSTDSLADASSSVTLVSCVVQTGTPLIPSFTEIMSEQPSSTAAVVTVASVSILSLSLLGESGIASTVNSRSSPPHLSTIVTSSHFHNLTATPVPHSQPRHRPTQVLTGNEMSRVDDALYGTVASILGHSQSFDLINSTLLECENPRTGRNADDPTIKNITGTYTFTSSAGYFRNETGFTHYHFTSCIITSTEQTASFTIINIGSLSGAVKLTSCSITIDCQHFHVTVMFLKGAAEGRQSLSIDSCCVKYDKNDALAQTNNQILTYYSVMTDITHSTFESPKGDSRTRTFLPADSVAFIQVNNCRFKGQTTSSTGSVFSFSGTYQICLLSDSLFEGNKAGAFGGSVATSYAHQSFSRCVFRQNEADMRGGALYLIHPQHLFFEDTHFDNNKAKEKLSTTNDYAHYRGNDIASTPNCSFYTETNVIGCTSSTPSNKIGYYNSAVGNADLADQNKYFPTPIETKVNQLFVETGRTGEDCDESNPCPLVSTAVSKAESIFTQIHVAVGDCSLSDETITKSIQIVGQGWMVNSTKSTTLKMGGVTVGSYGNLTLTSLSLKPLNTSSVLLSHSAATATSLVKDVRIENLEQHTVPLFSFSQGTATLRVCAFNTIALTTSAAVSVNGSASLTLYQVWFMHVSSLSTTGGSCLDVNTSASVSIEMSDASRCSSNGPTGAFFITKVGSSTLTLKSLIFTENKASSSLSQIGNDIVLSGFPFSFVSISSPISSVSAKPHCLVVDSQLNGQIQNFQIPNFGYHEYGIHHPINTRFYFGLPMSQFKGVSQTVNDLVSPGTQVDIRIKNDVPIIMEETTFSNRTAYLRLLVIQHNSTSPTSCYTLREDVTFRLIGGQIQLPADPDTTPFIVDGSTSLFMLTTSTITLPPILSRPFIINKAGTTHMNSASFNSTLSLQGCSFIESLSGTVKVDYLTISNIHSDVNGSYLNAKNTSLQFHSFEFVNCSAQHGGALFVVLDSSHYIQFQFIAPYTTSFRDCRATALDENGVLVGKGGAIYVKGTSTNSRPIRFNTTALNHARFENNTAARGNDVFIESSLFAGKTVDQIPVFGGGSLSNMYRVAIEGRDSEEDKETIHYFLPSPSISVNGSVIEPISGPSGTDDDNCKWTGTHCATLTFGVKHLKQKYEDGRHFPQQIRFVWNMTYTEKAIVITDQDITVSGTTTTNAKTAKVLRSILEVDKDAVEGSFVFTIENKSLLAVTNLDIHPVARCGMFDLKDDAHSLKLDGVCLICSDSESYRHPLIKSTKHPVSLQNCHFNTTDASIGQAIFAVPLVSFSSTEYSFSIKSSSFKSFSVSGHALIAVTTKQPISFVSVKFDDITQTVSGKARCVHVTSSSLSTVVTPSGWSSFTPTQPLLDFIGCDSSLTSDHPFFESSLLFHLLPPTGTVVAGQTPDNEESEHPECGTDRLRCSTLNSALSSALSHSLSTHINVAGQVNLSSPLEVTTTATFSSSSGKQTVAQSSAGSVTMNKIGHTLSCDSLMFSLDHSRTLSLTACDIGTPTVTSLSETCLSLADVADGASLSLTGSVFQNVKFSHPSLGSAIVLRLGSSFSFDTSSLFSSVSSNAIGSLVFVESADISSTAQLPSFVLLKTTMEPLPSRLFTDEEKKRFVGKVDGKDAESLLFFWFPHSAKEATLDVDANGEVHPNCGLPQLPCRTLESGFASLKATKSAVLLNNADRIKTVLAAAFAEQTIKSKSEKQEVTIECSGGLSVSTNQQLILDTIVFVFEAGKRTSPFASVSAGSLQLMSCSFGTDTPTSLGSSLLHVKGSLEVESSSFSKLSTTDEKGLIWMEQTDLNVVSFVSTTITCCTSSSAPLISLTFSSTSQQDSWDFDFSGISFTESSSNDAPTGTLVFIAGSSFATHIVPSRFPLINSETDENKFWGFDSSTSVDSSLLVYLVEIGSEVDVDGKKGKDIAHCGHFGVACSTIGKGIGRGTAEDASKQINIQDATKVDERITPNSITLSIVGETGQRPISGSLAVTSCSFTSFSSSTSPSILSATIQPAQSVILSEISFVSCNSTDSTRSGVLDVTLSEGSTFTLTHSINRFASCSSPKATANLIFISHPSLSESVISSCLQFVWTKTSDSLADFAGKEAEHPVPILAESTSILLNNNTFTSCTCSGQANAIFLELENTTTVHADSFDYLMTDLVFDSHSSNSDTEIEIDVFVVGNNLDKTMTSTKWENSFSREKGSSLWGEDTATGLNISLLPYLVALEGPVEIDDDGKGFEKCGHFFLFCNSLELGLRRMKDASVDTMKVMEDHCNDSTRTEVRSVHLRERRIVNTVLLVGWLLRQFSERYNSVQSVLLSLFSSLSGTLSFTSCTIAGSSPNPVAFSLITLTTGDLLFLHTLEISCLQSTPLIASSGSISMTNCNFTSISRVDGLGCVLEADSSGSILVQHCLFVSCISNSTTNWIHLLGADTHTLNKENWEGTLNTSSLRSSVLLSTSLLSASSISDIDPHSLLYEFYPRVEHRLLFRRMGRMRTIHSVEVLSFLAYLWTLPVDLTKVRTVEINGEGEVKTQMKMDGDFLTIEGHKKRGVVKIVGKGQIVNNVFDDPDTLLLSFVSLDLSQSTLEEGGIVVNENGEVKLDSNILTGGQAVVVNLTLTDLSFSRTVFDFSSFDSVSLPRKERASLSNRARSSEAPPLPLKMKSKTEQTMSATGQTRAVKVDGGSLTVEGSIFHDNSVVNSSFPSVRRNIHCVSGETYDGNTEWGDGTKDFPSAWIKVEEGCQFSKVETKQEDSAKTVKLAGKLLIPCGLSLEVFEWNEKSKTETDKSTEISLATANIQNWNETSLELILNESSLSNTLNVEHEWRLRLVFGDGVAGTEWITVKQSRAAESSNDSSDEGSASHRDLCHRCTCSLHNHRVRGVLSSKSKTVGREQNLLNQQELDHVEVKVDVEESMNMMADRFSNNFQPNTLSESKLEGQALLGLLRLKSLDADLQIGLGADLKVYTQICHFLVHFN